MPTANTRKARGICPVLKTSGAPGKASCSGNQSEMFNAMWLVLALAALGTLVCGEHPAPPPLSYSMDGETVIAVFAGLHFPALPSLHRPATRPAPEGNGHPNSVAQGSVVAECGSVAWRGVQQAAAAEWALKAINNQTSPDHHIGLRILDTCSSPELAVLQLMTLLGDTSKPGATPLIGVVSVGGAAESGALLPLLNARSVPLLVTSAEAAYDLSPSPVLFASTPHLDIQMQSLIAAMGRLLPRAGGSRVGVVWSCWRAAESLKREAAKAGLVITLTTQVTHAAPNNPLGGKTVPLQQQILHFASDNKLQSGDVVILLLKVEEAHQLAQGHPVQGRPPSQGGPQPLKHLRLRWLLSSVEDDPLAHEIDILQLNEALPGVVVVGPHSPHLTMLQRRLVDEVCSQHEDLNKSGGNSSGGGIEKNGVEETKASMLAPVLQQYCQALKQQTTPAHPASLSSPLGPSAPSIPHPSPSATASLKMDTVHSALSPASSLTVDATHSASVLRAVSSLAAAFRILQLEHCSAMEGCTVRLGKDLPSRMVEGLQKLSYDAGEGADRLHYTADARLFTTFSIVTVVKGELMQVGLFREGAGVEWSEEPLPLMQHLLRGSNPPPFSLSKPLVAHRSVYQLPPTEKGAEWRATAWSVFVCVAAAVGLVCCCCIATYVSIRGCDGTLQGSQVPGLLVLAGTCGVLTGAVVMILPVQLTDAAALCCLQHLLPYTALALAYAALLTKALHARLQHALESRTQIPRAVLYLPLAALMALAVLLAALGDQTTMHLLLPNEIPAAPRSEAALAAYTAPAPASPGVIALHSTDVVNDTRPLTFEIVQICKRLDQIPAIIGFAYLIVMLFVTLLMLATSKSTKTRPDDFYECRRVIAVCGVSMPLVALWGAVTLYAPLHLQPPLTALSLLLVAYALLGLYLLPKLRHITSRNAKQFSHKPLSGAGTVSTVFTSSTKLPATPIVSYTSRGGDGGCRFSDAIMCNDLIEKYKLRDANSGSSDRANTIAGGVLVSPYKIPRPETIFPTLQPSQHQCSCEGQWEAAAMSEPKGRRP